MHLKARQIESGLSGDYTWDEHPKLWKTGWQFLEDPPLLDGREMGRMASPESLLMQPVGLQRNQLSSEICLSCLTNQTVWSKLEFTALTMSLVSISLVIPYLAIVDFLVDLLL